MEDGPGMTGMRSEDPAPLDPEDGTLDLSNLVLSQCPDGQARPNEDGECEPLPSPPPSGQQPGGQQPGDQGGQQPMTPTMYCGMARDDPDDRCRLYEALPSALLAMNGLPTYAERCNMRTPSAKRFKPAVLERLDTFRDAAYSRLRWFSKRMPPAPEDGHSRGRRLKIHCG